MPLTQIHLRAGKTPKYLRALSQGVLQTLFKTLATKDNPQPGKFQTLFTFDRECFCVDKGYGGIRRSDDTVYIYIFTVKFSARAKKRTFQELIKALGKSPGIPKEDLFIVFVECPPENWYFGRFR